MPSDNTTRDLVTYAEAARRLVAEGLVDEMSRQRLRQLDVGRKVGDQTYPPDPDFPSAVVREPRVVMFDYEDLRKWAISRDRTSGVRKHWPHPDGGDEDPVPGGSG